MKYLCLIYDEEAKFAALPQEEKDAILHAYPPFIREFGEKGNFLLGNALQSVRTAVTVRVREGKFSRTDGPFAETKEQLGGFCLIEAADLDTALQVAAKIPSATTGSIEVRPIQVFE
jgi:hypothetical protein